MICNNRRFFVSVQLSIACPPRLQTRLPVFIYINCQSAYPVSFGSCPRRFRLQSVVRNIHVSVGVHVCVCVCTLFILHHRNRPAHQQNVEENEVYKRMSNSTDTTFLFVVISLRALTRTGPCSTCAAYFSATNRRKIGRGVRHVLGTISKC